MVKIKDTLFCDGCGVEILLSPVIKGHREYCCEECAQGYECECGLHMELEQLQGEDDDSSFIAGSP